MTSTQIQSIITGHGLRTVFYNSTNNIVAVHSAVHFTNAALKQNIGDKKIRFGCYQWADKADQRKKQRRTLVIL